LPAQPDPLDLDWRDAGCGETCALLDRYVEAELAGEDVREHFLGVAVHLDRCPACRADHDGLITAVTRSRSRSPGRPRRRKPSPA
jgi:hypothetical protein